MVIPGETNPTKRNQDRRWTGAYRSMARGNDQSRQTIEPKGTLSVGTESIDQALWDGRGLERARGPEHANDLLFPTSDHLFGVRAN